MDENQTFDQDRIIKINIEDEMKNPDSENGKDLSRMAGLAKILSGYLQGNRLLTEIILLEQYQKENRELSAKVKVLTAQIEAGGLDSAKVESAATMPLKSIGISVRTYNILRHTLGFSTLGEVATMTKEQLRMTRNLGRKSYSEILQVLEYHGLTLKEF